MHGGKRRTENGCSGKDCLEMKILWALVKRNTVLFFKDKGMFFTSLATPIILLVLYATFLGNVYESSFESVLKAFGFEASERLLNGCVGGQLFSSLLSVSCVTVAFCSNLLMVQDKANGTRSDLTVSPVNRTVLAFSYYIATAFATLLVSLAAMAACLIYVAAIGWYMSVADVLLILLDVIMLVLFGTAFSSIIDIFLSSQGQISAVSAIISAGYGFICGAYMPVSEFSEGLKNVLAFFPGIYGMSLLRNHAMRGPLAELEAEGLAAEGVEIIRDMVDCNIYFMDKAVPTQVMYAGLLGAIALLFAAFILVNAFVKRVKK